MHKAIKSMNNFSNNIFNHYVSQYSYHDDCFSSSYLCIKLMNNSIQTATNKDKLSSIQTNLHEMKEEVNQYLKKSNIDSVPPVLRARNYLLLNYMQSLKKKDSSTQKPGIKKELSSQRLGNVMDGDRFEPLRESPSHQFDQEKKVKHKRNVSGSSKSGTECFLPNIGHVKLDFQEKIFTCKSSRNGKLQGKSLQINQDRQEQFLKVRRYLKEQDNPQKDSQGKNTSNRLSGSISRRLFDALDRYYSKKISEHHLAFSQQLPFNMPDIVQENQTRARMREEKARINSKLAEQRKQSIFKRRNQVKSISNREEYSNEKFFKKYQSHLTPRKLSKESRYRPKLTEKDQCSPWQQGNLAQSFFIQQMQP